MSWPHDLTSEVGEQTATIVSLSSFEITMHKCRAQHGWTMATAQHKFVLRSALFYVLIDNQRPTTVVVISGCPKGSNFALDRE